jgi:hypothetical protein
MRIELSVLDNGSTITVLTDISDLKAVSEAMQRLGAVVEV